ncbi:SDR family oxidoreductase [Rhodococcus sp. KBS0724]|uniref:SDR family NAD(P)-dependent oxidoreductase n=1 Tax=Rhodococcus sp. KBS0724 TaxID=1179674 RepID=UPI00110EC36E|nr:SDR family oxidoreductase [Rhodococcus sp. KBS0724]TSD40360.1 SDR family oxidoreductase [Rhodococcus sp. KBS0724]
MSSTYFEEVARRAIEAGDSMEPMFNDRMPASMIDKRLTDLLDLRGRRVVITGGGGRGLGTACANRFAGLGADVALVDLKVDDPSDTGSLAAYSGPDPHGVAAAVSEKWGTKAFGVFGDAMDWEDINRWMAECNDLLGGIDVLVNSAVDVATGAFKTCTVEDMTRSVRGTIMGPMFTSRVALDYMRPQGRGHIINVGSGAANSPSAPDVLLYGTGKAWLGEFSRFLAAEVISEGVNVLQVNPATMVRTPERIPTTFDEKWFYSRLTNKAGRYMFHEELANVIAFLTTDAASPIIGEVINADLGSSLH